MGIPVDVGLLAPAADRHRELVLECRGGRCGRARPQLPHSFVDAEVRDPHVARTLDED